jgi:hypothetical protein
VTVKNKIGVIIQRSESLLEVSLTMLPKNYCGSLSLLARLPSFDFLMFSEAFEKSDLIRMSTYGPRLFCVTTLNLPLSPLLHQTENKFCFLHMHSMQPV